MKKRMLGVAAIAALALLPGCGKKEAQPVPGPTKPQDSVQQTPAAEPQKQLKAVQADAVQAVEKTAAAAAAVPTPAAERAEAAVPAVAAKVEAEAKTATSAFDKLVAEAQALITNRKYTDALA
jgi:predicted small lipoprotein YifL